MISRRGPDGHAEEGNVVGKRRIGDDAAGFMQLVQLLAEAGDTDRSGRVSPAPRIPNS